LEQRGLLLGKKRENASGTRGKDNVKKYQKRTSFWHLHQKQLFALFWLGYVRWYEGVLERA
jgi:hypothetical protein